MKRTFATSLFACLLATVFALPQALAGNQVYGPPAATLKVGQIPRVDDDVMTPLPDDSALPSDPVKVADVPPVAGAMPVAHVEVHDLTPMDKITAPVVADAMPPNPSPIRNARESTSIKTAAAEPVKYSAPVKYPAKDNAASAQPHGPSSLPFPPSADDWAARMPLGNTMKTASGAPPPGRDKMDTTAAFTAPKMIHVDNRSAELASPQTPPVLSLETDTEAQSPPVPGPAIVHHNAPRNYAMMDQAPPAHIVVQSAPPQSSECRDYTRTLQGSHGRQAAGTACLDEDGVWRIAEEHLLPQAHHVSVRVVSAPPAYYYPEPVQEYEPAYVMAGYGYGYGRGHRGWRGWR